jgi:hypothetical protein
MKRAKVGNHVVFRYRYPRSIVISVYSAVFHLAVRSRCVCYYISMTCMPTRNDAFITGGPHLTFDCCRI